MQCRIISIYLVVLACLCTFPGRAQVGTAQLGGSITDPQSSVIPNADVRLVSISQGTSAMAKTNHAGQFTFPALLPGTYKIFVQADGFETLAVDNITLNVGDNKQASFQLKVGKSSETITVDASGLTLNTTDGSVSTVVDRNFVENMPLNGRSFQTLLTLAPGAVQVPSQSSSVGYSGEIVVNGQRSEANYLTVDGVSVNTGTSPNGSTVGAGYAGGVPGETIFGTTQSLVSIDALEEFRASTSTYSAEYGRTPGGQFSFSTRVGTNIWHGSLYDYLRNNAMDANNWFNDAAIPPVPKQAEKQNDFGGTLGGPLVIPQLYNGRDRTFFFFSHEGMRLTTPYPVEQYYVPDSALRQNAPAPLQSFLHAFPVANGGEDGFNDGLAFYNLAYSSPSSLDSTGIRIDHNLGEKVRLFARYADTPSSTWTFLYPAIKRNESSEIRGVTAGMTTAITSTQENELRFNLTQNDLTANSVSTNFGGASPFDYGGLPGADGQPLTGPGTSVALLLDFNGRAAQFAGAENTTSQRQYNVVDTHAWSYGAHHFKFGLDWRRLTTYTRPIVVSETGEFLSEAAVLANKADVIPYQHGTSAVEPLYHNFSTFLQDEWKITPQLSLSLGVRWDINPAPGNLIGHSPYTVNQITDLRASQLAPPNTSLWKTDWRGFAPRLGVAYQLRQAPGHQTILRTGFGIFYDTGNLLGAEGLSGAVGFSSSGSLAATAFPLSSTQWASLPQPGTAAPYTATVYAFDPNLRLPYTMQWNLAIEQGLGAHQALSATYVGAAGRKLLAQFYYEPAALGNHNFTSSGLLYITSNLASSDYDSLQVKYQAAISRGLQALALYMLSHSLDDASNNFRINQLIRSSSDFDIRHNVQAAVTYSIPGSYSNRLASVLLKKWGIDSRISVRSALPVNVVGTTGIDPLTRQFAYYSPNVVPGQPTYIYGSQYPGGRKINYNAYTKASSGVQGDAGRNPVRGFGEWQADMAARREFPIKERLKLQFRAEAFNVFNHPNFGSIYNLLSYGPTLFGNAYQTLNVSLGVLNPLYQTGGPRSLQTSLKLVF